MLGDFHLFDLLSQRSTVSCAVPMCRKGNQVSWGALGKELWLERCTDLPAIPTYSDRVSTVYWPSCILNWLNYLLGSLGHGCKSQTTLSSGPWVEN